MEQINEILGWFATGSGRYIAAALLFLTMQAVKRLPVVKDWLETDSGKVLGIAWTAKRKKAVTATLLSLSPIVPLLASDMPLELVLKAAAEIVAEAMGLHALWGVAKDKPDPANDNASAVDDRSAAA